MSRCVVLVIAAVSLACAHTRLELRAGTRKQGAELGDVSCELRWNGTWRGERCGARPQLVVSAVSDCLTEGTVWFAVNDPAESRLVVPDLAVSLEPDRPARFETPCFTTPSASTTVSMSMRARCVNTLEKLSASARCVMP